MLNLLKDYTLKRADLLKLEATEKGLSIGSSVILVSFCALFLLFFLALFNVGIALLIGDALDSYAAGFLIVAGVYLLCLVILVIAAKPFKRTISNKLLQIFNDD